MKEELRAEDVAINFLLLIFIDEKIWRINWKILMFH